MALLDAIERRQLIAAARHWLRHDPDPDTRAELELLVREERWEELVACMRPLEFGTAGLRALEGPGPGRMNLAVVIRTARGLAEDLRRRQVAACVLPIVVGFDARKNSRRYADAFTRVLVAAGIPVRYFETPVPTPLVAYAARYFGARAAVCITASHNPPEYAGLKVYADNAVQIVAPQDAEIARAIAAVPPADQVPLADSLDAPSGAEGRADLPSAQVIGNEVGEAYLNEVAALRYSVPRPSPLRIVYTPLHGVGGRWVFEVLKRAGYRQLFPVAEQFEPDAAFPTLGFPNPEEPGVLDRALARAREVHADLVLANDPDADRLAVSVPDEAGGFYRLSGNQVGLLLAEFLLTRQPVGPRPLVVSSIVSSPMLDSIAAAHGAACARTLTGFKWMLNAGLALERDEGLHLVFGFEEALGYCARGPVHDKDGISGALLFADLASELVMGGRQVGDALEQLYRQHGVWASQLDTLVWADSQDPAARATRKLCQLVANPPRQLAGLGLLEMLDYTRGADERPWYLGWAELVELRLEGSARVLVRPSGTEPKLKVYADFRAEYVSGRAAREQELAAELQAGKLARALIELLADW